jgi:hypothetical protein
MKIAIYGDSFADPTWNTNTYKSWPELLAETYDVTNYAVQGSSLWWSYNKFKSVNTEYDYNIFVGTIYSRIYLPNLKKHLSANHNSWPTVGNLNLGKLYFLHYFLQEREWEFSQLMVKELLTYNNIIYVPAFHEAVLDSERESMLPLCMFSDHEIEFYNDKNFIRDHRKCHLTKDNNKVVYDKIIDAINNKTKILALDKSNVVNPVEPKGYYFD